MKLSALLSINAAMAYPATTGTNQAPNPMMNMLLMESLMGDDSSGDDMLMMMMMSPGLMGQNPDQANQMSSMLPLLLMLPLPIISVSSLAVLLQGGGGAVEQSHPVETDPSPT